MPLLAGDNYRQVMGGLIYTAVLGSALVWYIQGVAEYVTPQKTFVPQRVPGIVTESYLLFALLLVLYSPAPFLLFRDPIPNYTGLSFFFDLLETVVIFCVFYNLDLVKGDAANMGWAFTSFLGIPGLAIVHHVKHQTKEYDNIILSCGFIALAGLGVFVNVGVDLEPKGTNLFILALMYVVLVAYYTGFLKKYR